MIFTLWSSSSKKDVTTPPTIGAAIRRITSKPAPWLHMIVDLPDARARVIVIVASGFDRETLSAVLEMLGSRVS